MKFDQSVFDGAKLDESLYEIMYFSPIQVGNERYNKQLYFQTDPYARVWPETQVNRMLAQSECLRRVELGLQPADEAFKRRHRETMVLHCKMALAYLDSREARIAMKLCDAVLPATKSTEVTLALDPVLELELTRIMALSLLSCAARRVKMYKRAVDALDEAKNICFQSGAKIHPLTTCLTLLNLSAVLGDIDDDYEGLRWGLEALSLMYGSFPSSRLPKAAQDYYLVLACHNAALLNVKLCRWDDAVELVNEGIEITKSLPEHGDDDLRTKLIAIGARAKDVPEVFLTEALNALNGWGEESEVWNLKFWDFTANEIREDIHVLQNTKTLRHLIIDHKELENESRFPAGLQDEHLARFVNAIVSCMSLEKVTVSGVDFHPRKVWCRMHRQTFLETSWYASAMKYNEIVDPSLIKPEIAMYKGIFKELDAVAAKIVLFLVVLGNECEGVDLSENNISRRRITALVTALRWNVRPKFTRHISTLILRSAGINADVAMELAKVWQRTRLGASTTPPRTPASRTSRARSSIQESPRTFHLFDVDPDARLVGARRGDGVTSLDVSENEKLGDEGFEFLVAGMRQSPPFKSLTAETINLRAHGCRCMHQLACTNLEKLALSNNSFGSEGARTVCEAASQFVHLQTLELNSCDIDAAAAPALSKLVEGHQSLQHLQLCRNRLESDGAIVLCKSVAASVSLKSLHLAYNKIHTEEAAEAIGEMMQHCPTLIELSLSGNQIDPAGATHIGSSLENSSILTLVLEDMGFTDTTIDDLLDHGAAETQDLQVMVMNNNRVGDRGLGIIAECLSIGLTELALSNCGLTWQSETTLLNLVSLSPNLRSLDLSRNALGPTGLQKVIDWMTRSKEDSYSLRSLELGHCQLGDKGFLRLVTVLGALTYLGAKGNSITSDGLKAVMDANRMIQLKRLDLADNLIGEDGVQALTVRLQQETKKSLWNPRQLTSTIDQVILTNNKISPALAASTDIFLKIHNPLLQVVW